MTDKKCPFCREEVIWARLHVEGRQGKRSAAAFSVERCDPGTGDVVLTPGLFLDGAHPRAEYVSNGTSYRAHRPHCAAFDEHGRSFTGAVRPRKRPEGGRA
jgi:hypothetical protein